MKRYWTWAAYLVTYYLVHLGFKLHTNPHFSQTIEAIYEKCGLEDCFNSDCKLDGGEKFELLSKL